MVLTIESVQTSCGFGVPRLEYHGERNDLVDWANKKGEDGLRQYHADKNHVSIDGLPTLGTSIFPNGKLFCLWR